LTGNGAGNRLALKSFDASQWYLNSTGTRSISSVDVQNSYSQTAITAGTPSIGSGTNTNWTIIA